METTRASPVERSVSIVSDTISSSHIKEAILESENFELNNSYDKINISKVGGYKTLQNDGSAVELM